ncbi:hypothetical protein KPG66_10770 [Mycetohabitans sp. B2]|uniref:hypothetical protein n=1 Tax=Mycetohabitans sp. B2 TaxID=2841274 RepID=UPI001F23D125|nr:hypothetical protein [Mycetohabitans sp. B2]MCF7696554.1 hypothetical protein [Mycetohabitans sp. B2]
MPYNIKIPANGKQCLRRKSLTDTSDSGNANHRSDVVRYDPGLVKLSLAGLAQNNTPAHVIISPQSSHQFPLPTKIRSPSSLGISAQAIRPYLQEIARDDSNASKFDEEKWNQYSGLVAKYLRQMQHGEMSVGLAYMLNMSDNSRLLPRDKAEALEASLNQDGGTFKKLSPAWHRRQEIFQEIDLLKAAGDKNAAVGDQQKHASISYAGLEDDRTPPGYVRAYMAIYAPSKNDKYKDIYLDQNGEWVTQSSKLWIGLGTPHRALSWFMHYHLDDGNPLIRSFLVNKKFLRDHLGEIEIEETRNKKESGRYMLNVDIKEINQFGVDAKAKNGDKSPLLKSLLKHAVPGSLRTIGFSCDKKFHNEMEGGIFIRLSDFLEDLGLGDKERLFWFDEKNQMTIYFNEKKGYKFSSAKKFEDDFVLYKSFFHMIESMESMETKEMLADPDIKDRFNSMLKSLLMKNEWMPKDLDRKLMESENMILKNIEKLRELAGRPHSTSEMYQLDKKLEEAKEALKNANKFT